MLGRVVEQRRPGSLILQKRDSKMHPRFVLPRDLIFLLPFAPPLRRHGEVCGTLVFARFLILLNLVIRWRFSISRRYTNRCPGLRGSSFDNEMRKLGKDTRQRIRQRRLSVHSKKEKYSPCWNSSRMYHDISMYLLHIGRTENRSLIWSWEDGDFEIDITGMYVILTLVMER